MCQLILECENIYKLLISEEKERVGADFLCGSSLILPELLGAAKRVNVNIQDADG